MNFCPKCGYDLKDEVAIQDQEDLNFCPKCGKQIDGFVEDDFLKDDLERKVVDMLQNRQFVQAVKLVREKTGWGLKESKFFVQEVGKRNNLRFFRAPLTAKGRFISYLIIAGFLGLMISSAGLAIWPKFGLVAKPFLCGGDLRIHSSKVYTLPGQAGYTTGVNRSFHCADGSVRTGRVFLISTVVYTLILLALLYLRRFFKVIRGAS